MVIVDRVMVMVVVQEIMKVLRLTVQVIRVIFNLSDTFVILFSVYFIYSILKYNANCRIRT